MNKKEKMNKMNKSEFGYCDHYCNHGGTCSLELNHDGDHNDSGYCQWSSEESIPKEEADLIFMGLSPLPDELNALLRNLT